MRDALDLLRLSSGSQAKLMRRSFEPPAGRTMSSLESTQVDTASEYRFGRGADAGGTASMHGTERRFVNPYTFVPFPPEGVKRERAPEHTFDADEAERRYSGSFTVRWQVLTDLILPKEEHWYDSRTQTLTIPGSSAKGAVRSVHETLFAGCPRVLTSTFTPVYRQPVAKDLVAEWDLAVVIESTDAGVPRKVRLCGEPVWINAVSLRTAYRGKIPSTGDTLHGLDSIRPVRGVDREEFRPNEPRAVQVRGREEATWEKGSYVFLVTDVAARKTTKNQRNPVTRAALKTTIGGQEATLQEVASCYWAAGKLGAQLAAFPSQDSSAFADFQRLSEGSRDHQVNEQQAKKADAEGETYSPEPFEDVTWWAELPGVKVRLPGETGTANRAIDVTKSDDGRFRPSDQSLWQVVGRRRRADGRLYAGDVIWVKTAPPASGKGPREVTAVKLAAAWRATPEGAGSLEGRVQATPCRDANHLCLSCSIFGSIDATGEAAGKGQQDAYGSHVRFGAITAKDMKLSGEKVRLAPLSSPRPGAAQFYLARTAPGGGSNGVMPAQWGSEIGGARQVRGRKFYWHSDPTTQVKAVEQAGVSNPKPRHLLAGSGDSLQTVVDLLAPGQSLTQTISFDGLDRLALLTLLAAFDPNRILGGQDCAIHLGGGKPFGLGSVSATVVELSVTTVASRYGDSRPAALSWSWKPQDRDELRRRCGDLAAVHEAAAKVMARHGLGDDEPFVSYPITKPWSSYGSKGFAEAFEFFKKNSGETLATRTQPYVVLPDLNDVAQGKASPAIKDGGTNA